MTQQFVPYDLGDSPYHLYTHTQLTMASHVIKMNMADCSNTNSVSTAEAPSRYYTNHAESEKDIQRDRVGVGGGGQ